MNGASPVLEVKGLSTVFRTRSGSITAVDGVSFELYPGETLGVVGESGSGKSVMATSIMRMVRSPGKIVGGEIKFKGQDLLSLPEPEMRRVRGEGIGMVFQDPLTALNPVMTVGKQVAESLIAHGKPPEAARKRAVELLRMVGITDAEHRFHDYPHQFSGGMRQRVVAAIALSNDPEVLIADEPTTALDVTIQAQILDLLKHLSEELGTAVILITHDMGVVAELCDRALVMYAGRVVESAPVSKLFTRPKHPYTWGLMRSVPGVKESRERRLLSIGGQPPDPGALPPGCKFHPRCQFKIDRCTSEEPQLDLVGNGSNHHAACWVTQEGVDLPASSPSDDRIAAITPEVAAASETAGNGPLLELKDVYTYFDVTSGIIFKRRIGRVKAVDGVSLSLRAGETLGLVGESGCGKSTLARAILGITPVTSGSILLRGEDITRATGKQLQQLRRRIQMIFQDPYASLNPRMTISDIVGEPLEVHGICTGREKAARVGELLELVGLSRRFAMRYPHELSGGQRQRIGIARALTLNPDLLVCDEPVSALDVSIQAQIVNLLADLQDELSLAYLFIAHDLAVVRHLSEKVAVMYLGKIVELGDTEAIYHEPRHPYTLSLLSAVPSMEAATTRKRERIVLTGDLPSPKDPPRGCRFHTRCPIGPMRNPERTICKEEEPPLTATRQGQLAACHFSGDLETFQAS